MGLINFTKDYAASEATNIFYYTDMSDSADRKPFRYDSTTLLSDTTNLTTYYSYLRKNGQYNEGFEKRWQFIKDTQSVNMWTPMKFIFALFHNYTVMSSRASR